MNIFIVFFCKITLYFGLKFSFFSLNSSRNVVEFFIRKPLKYSRNIQTEINDLILSDFSSIFPRSASNTYKIEMPFLIRLTGFRVEFKYNFFTIQHGHNIEFDWNSARFWYLLTRILLEFNPYWSWRKLNFQPKIQWNFT